MSSKCHDCGRNDADRSLPEAGSAVNKVMLRGSSKALRHALDAHDLGSGVVDCGCVVMDYQFYPCKKHGGRD